MQYMLLIYDDEQLWAGMDEAQRGQVFQAYGADTEDMRQKGAFVAGDALQPTSTATTVRERDGDRLVTDGPFAETKEQLGGYYLIDVPGMDEAIAAGEKLPSARMGSIEIRPVMEFPDQAAAVDAAVAQAEG